MLLSMFAGLAAGGRVPALPARGGDGPVLLLDDPASADRRVHGRGVLGGVRPDRMGGAGGRRGSWRGPALVPVTTIAVLLLVATLVHLDKFDLDSIFGWFWLVVYCSVPPALAVLVWAQARRPAGPAPPGRPIPARAARRAAAAGRRDGRAGRGHVRRALDGRGPVALGPDTAHRAGRERLSDRVRGRGGLRGLRTTGWRPSPARPTPTRRWERWSCSPPRCSRDDLDGGARTRSTSRSPSRCWRSGAAGSLAVRRVQRS